MDAFGVLLASLVLIKYKILLHWIRLRFFLIKISKTGFLKLSIILGPKRKRLKKPN